MPASTQNAQKDNRLRLGPLALAAVENAEDQKQKSQIIEDIVSRSAALEGQLAGAHKRIKSLSQLNTILNQFASVMRATGETLDAHSKLMQERYRRLDQLHLHSRMLIGSKVTQGSERERIFDHMMRLATNLEAHVDALGLSEAQKIQAHNNEVARMQQLLQEAGAYENDMDQQLEMSELDAGGFER